MLYSAVSRAAIYKEKLGSVRKNCALGLLCVMYFIST